MKILLNTLLFVGVTLATQTLHAEGKAAASPGFWEMLKAKMEQMAPQKRMTATTAVGGVRGAKMASDDVYWKGEQTAQLVDADELAAFQSAMTLASAGEMAKAQAAFAEFVSKNPDSSLRKDAELALAQLQAPQ